MVAHVVAAQSLEGDQIPIEEIKFQKPGAGVWDWEARNQSFWSAEG